MDYVKLNGRDILTDAEQIRNEMEKDSETVFLYCGEGALYDYIHALCGEGKLYGELLYQWKVCYSNETLDVSFLVREAEKWVFRRHITSMTDLVGELDGKNPCRIVINTDSQKDRSFIVQQLIFLRYPLELADVLLWWEAREMEEESLFWHRADANLEEISENLRALFGFTAQERDTEDSRMTPEILRKARETLRTCAELRWQMEFLQMEFFQSRKVKLAIAASKKTGKSVMVNCFIGEEVAPTDVQLATPNNCIYQKSPDGKYHLQMDGGGEARTFSTREEIHEAIGELFRAAQNDYEHGFSLPDMHVGYRGTNNHASSYTIYDTAGPDAAGTTHRKASFRAIKECDVALFAIDYGKYLTDSEEEYLNQIKSIFQSQQKFHSLIFALNKIDVRYTDTRSPKSIVEATDFIRTRLSALAEEYQDCVIFPTCALEYLCAVEAEDAGVTEFRSPTDNVRKVKLAHKDVPALAFLHTHSENLEYYHGIEEFSYDVFKRDSGMPALMNYVFRMATRTGARWRNLERKRASDIADAGNSGGRKFTA